MRRGSSFFPATAIKACPTPFPVRNKQDERYDAQEQKAEEEKAILKPIEGLELKWRIKVMRKMPVAPPIVRNMPRRPMIVATFSGINSMHALLAPGLAMPAPMPVASIRMAEQLYRAHPAAEEAPGGEAGGKKQRLRRPTMERPQATGRR